MKSTVLQNIYHCDNCPGVCVNESVVSKKWVFFEKEDGTMLHFCCAECRQSYMDDHPELSKNAMVSKMTNSGYKLRLECKPDNTVVETFKKAE